MFQQQTHVQAECNQCVEWWVQMLLSPNVAYVRSILLDEMAKGVDSAARLAADNAVSRARDTLRTAFSVRVLLSLPGLTGANDRALCLLATWKVCLFIHSRRSKCSIVHNQVCHNAYCRHMTP